MLPIFDLQKRVQEATERAQQAQQKEMANVMKSSDVIHRSISELPSGFCFKTDAMQHQIDTLYLSHGKPHFAYFMEMGTGKSKILIDETAFLYGQGKVDALLVFANKGSYLNWVKEEIPKHMPDHIPIRMTYWDSQASTALLESYKKILEPFEGLKVLIVNVEALAYDKATNFCLKFVKAHKVMGAVDESTTIKNEKAKRTESAIKIGALCKYRRIMTGSPITNNPLDLFSQAKFLGQGLLGFSSFYSFRARYAEMVVVQMGSRSFKKVKDFRHLDELTRNLQTWSYRVLKADCLDLPPKIYETRYVELTDEQKRYYKQLKDEAFIALGETDIVSAPLVITKLLRLHQLVCGHMKTDDGKVIEVKSNRMDTLVDTIEESSGKSIIFATYREDIVSIHKRLTEEFGPRAAITYYGDTKKEQREEAVHRFQNDPECRFFITNKTGAYGITLTAAENVIYYSNDYNLEVRIQGEDRPHRYGQTKSVTYIDLVTQKTVDEKIVKALKDKKHLADAVLGDGWREWLN